jgi:hypothetical protein
MAADSSSSEYDTETPDAEAETADQQQEINDRILELAKKRTLEQRLRELGEMLKAALRVLNIPLQKSTATQYDDSHPSTEEEAALRELAVSTYEQMRHLRTQREWDLARTKEQLKTTKGEEATANLARDLYQSVGGVMAAREQAMQQAAGLAQSESSNLGLMTNASGQAAKLKNALVSQYTYRAIAIIPFKGQEWAWNVANWRADHHLKEISKRLADPDWYHGEVKAFQESEAKAGRRTTVATPIDVYMAKYVNKQGRPSLRDETNKAFAEYSKSGKQLYANAHATHDPEQKQRLIDYLRTPLELARHQGASGAAQRDYRELATGENLQALVDFQKKCFGNGNALEAAFAETSRFLTKSARQNPGAFEAASEKLSEPTRKAIRNIQNRNFEALGAQLKNPNFPKQFAQEMESLQQESQKCGKQREELQMDVRARENGLLQLREGTRGFFDKVAGFFTLGKGGSVQRIGNRKELEELLDIGRVKVLKTPAMTQETVWAVQERAEDWMKSAQDGVNSLKEGAANNANNIVNYVRQVGFANADR